MCLTGGIVAYPPITFIHKDSSYLLLNLYYWLGNPCFVKFKYLHEFL